MPVADPAAVRALEASHALGGVRRLGIAARLAAEKGVEYVLEALPLVLAEFPRLRVLFAGPHTATVGEARYRARLRPALERHAERWTFLGTLEPEAMAAFYAACDVTLLPSVNSTESFGLVQVESMLCGTPVVATDLPGVRVPVETTGMGEVVPPRDPAALAAAVVRVLRDPDRYRRPRSEIAKHFSTARTCAAYLRLFRELSPAGSVAARAGSAT
jgi:glycosyltransferase involved in cell wall biosynthesis